MLADAETAGVTSVKRIAGPDRYATAALLYGLAMDSLETSDGHHYGTGGGTTVYLANGLTGFPDALSAGRLAGGFQDPLLTVPPDTLSATSAAFLTAHGAPILADRSRRRHRRSRE